MLAAPAIADDPDPVNREPATLQCVVLRAGPSDLRKLVGSNTIATAAVVSFLDRLPTPYADDQRVYRSASPISHVSGSAPAVLLVHGDADDTVPYQQSVEMEAALRKANVPVRLLTVAGGVHGSDFGNDGKPHRDFQQVLKESVAWLDRYLPR
jgi:dipeptidyl aminopeptidase/acylaminoacyl peptidase